MVHVRLEVDQKMFVSGVIIKLNRNDAGRADRFMERLVTRTYSQDELLDEE